MVSETQRAALKMMLEGLISVPHNETPAWLMCKSAFGKTVRVDTWKALLGGGYIEEAANNLWETNYRLTAASREVLR